MRDILHIILLLLTITLGAQQPSYERKINDLFEKSNGHFYTDKDSAYAYLKEVESVAANQKDWITVLDGLLSANSIADYHFDLQKIQNNLSLIDSLSLSHQNHLKKIPDFIFYKIAYLSDKATYQFQLYDFENSKKTFLETQNAINQVPDSIFDTSLDGYSALASSHIALMHSQEGKYDLAKENYEKNIRLLTTKLTGDKQQLYGNYALLAEVYKKEGDFKKANDYLLKTLDYHLKNKNKSSVQTVLNIVQNHNSLSQLDSAQHYLNIAEGILDPEDPYRSSFLQVSAETQQHIGNYEGALTDFENALELIHQKWDNRPHWEVAHVLNKMGILHAEFEQADRAIQSFDLALEQLSGSNTAVNQAKMVQILKNKAVLENQIKTNAQHLDATISVDLGIALLDSLKPGFKSHTDKLLLIEDAFPLFESGIQASYELYQTQKDEKHIDRAFLYFEKSKSVLLMEALLASKATEFGNIPSELLESEKQLKAQITHIEKQLNGALGVAHLQDELFELKNEHRNLITTIETDYPTYYDLKYNSDVISIFEAQQLLASDEALVTYFYGNEAIYAITLTNNSKAMLKIPVDDDLPAQIVKIHRMLSNPKSDVTALAQMTNSLYKSILEPPILSFEGKELRIVTDGLLNYIPFGALNTSENGISYLAERMAIGYANSVTLLQQLQERQLEGNKVLAFAPSFENSTKVREISKKLLPLPHNNREVAQIMNSFEGSPFLGEEASLKNFVSEIADFGIVHLATHAIFDDISPEDSYLAFTPYENEEYLLYVRDLYNMQLNADLVTLSACETGVGELKKGEGFMGLARGFFYGGASSISSTLWKINDASSTQLMDSFYQNLAQGDSKNLALQKAKVEFLKANNQNALSHPYYWSGFIISGNTQPLVNKTNWALPILGSLFAIAGGLYFYRKSRKAA